MNHLNRFTRQIQTRSIICLLLPGISGLSCYIVLREALELDPIISLLITVCVYLFTVLLVYLYIVPQLIEPIQKIWQAVWHISPNKENIPSPKLDNIQIGRELVSSLVMQIYDLVQNNPSAMPETSSVQKQSSSNENELLDSMPIPLLLVDKDQKIKNINLVGAQFFNLPKDKIIEKSLYDIARMSFSSDETLDSWLAAVSENKVTDSKSWEHIKLTLEDGKTVKQFDLSATYSKDSSSGNELVLALFDRTSTYVDQDKFTNYVAIAVHELRTPLTLLRGYIEVFEDELSDQLSPEHKEFMRKMNASAQTLTAFVSNILNVARIDENELILNLQEADWSNTLTDISGDLKLRASVRGKTIELDLASDLPAVAIDKISMYEVVSNLVDNAIKYSGQNHEIIIRTKLGDNDMIETEVQDFGAGIPENAIGGLFTRHYRSHRSKNAIAGSGLGLYLVKSIVAAHGGNVWVNSKEGEGSRFGFSLQTYEEAKKNTNTNQQNGIERQASGWIKNHSLYRR